MTVCSASVRIGWYRSTSVVVNVDNAEGLNAECRLIATDPVAQPAMQGQMTQLAEFFTAAAADAAAAEAAAAAAAITSPPPPPTTRPMPRTPPQIFLNCGTPARGAGPWLVTFGHSINTVTPIVAWYIDYGDGNDFTADNQATAERDMYWHEYRSPGDFTVTASVLAANGAPAQASCVFRWIASAPARTPASPRLPVRRWLRRPRLRGHRPRGRSRRRRPQQP